MPFRVESIPVLSVGAVRFVAESIGPGKPGFDGSRGFVGPGFATVWVSIVVGCPGFANCVLSGLFVPGRTTVPVSPGIGCVFRVTDVESVVGFCLEFVVSRFSEGCLSVPPGNAAVVLADKESELMVVGKGLPGTGFGAVAGCLSVV
jgi:hypothetical protein